ncbi:MAG: rhomboid family intramembrane serine protease [Bacteroidales bacterium]|nr:rhomboid family intramembrane serine protease [Bacteroidales bacterium]
MRLTISLILIGVIWAIWLLFGDSAIVYGIHPRDISSIRGIFFSTFIHANFNHIVSNTLPLFLLTWMLGVFYKRIWIVVWILITISGGALVWLFARANTVVITESIQNSIPTYHVGASLTIFALLGFFLASGIFRKEVKALLLAIGVGFLYGGAIISGIVPSDPHVSWEAHLFGFIAGIFWAYVFRKVKNIKEKTILPDETMT